MPKPSTWEIPSIERWSPPLTILAVFTILFSLRVAQDVLVPVVIAVLLAATLNPVVTFCEKAKLSRAVASALIMLSVGLGLGYMGYSLRGQALVVIDSLPDAARRVRELVVNTRGTQGPIDKVQKAASEIEKTAAAAAGNTQSTARDVPRVRLDEPAFRANDYLWWGSRGALEWAGQAAVIFFLVFFLLASGDLYKRKLLRLAGPTLTEKKISLQILKDIDGQIGRFLLVQVLTSTIVSIATWLDLQFLGVNQAGFWGIAAGILNSVPYFGAILVSTGLALVAFLQFGNWEMVFYVSGSAFVITSLEGFLLTPALMGKAARINQVALFIGILFWSWMWGFAGMILAVPIMMAVRSVAEHVESLWPLAELLSEKEAASDVPGS